MSFSFTTCSMHSSMCSNRSNGADARTIDVIETALERRPYYSTSGRRDRSRDPPERLTTRLLAEPAQRHRERDSGVADAARP